MAERLMAAGVPTVPAVYEGACHSFLEAMETSALARRGLDDGAAWLRARLHEPG
jgi:acetyl esterase